MGTELIMGMEEVINYLKELEAKNKKLEEENKQLKEENKELKFQLEGATSHVHHLLSENKSMEEVIRSVGHQETIEACNGFWYDEEESEEESDDEEITEPESDKP